MSRFSAPPSRAVPQDRQLRHIECHTFITRQAPLQCIKNPQKWLFLDVISTNNFELVWFFNFWPRRTRFARSQPTIASRFENKNVIFYIFRSLHHFKILISDTKSIDFIFCLENVLRSNGINQSALQMFCLLNRQMFVCEPNPKTTSSDFYSWKSVTKIFCFHAISTDICLLF